MDSAIVTSTDDEMNVEDHDIEGKRDLNISSIDEGIDNSFSQLPDSMSMNNASLDSRPYQQGEGAMNLRTIAESILDVEGTPSRYRFFGNGNMYLRAFNKFHHRQHHVAIMYLKRLTRSRVRCSKLRYAPQNQFFGITNHNSQESKTP